MIEREYKFLLPEDEFQRLRRLAEELFPDTKPVRRTQINHYYDTPGRDIRKRDITLRVRQVGETFCAQVKLPLYGGKGLTEKEELGRPLAELPQSIHIHSLFSVLPEIGECFPEGSLTTCRTTWRPRPGLRLEFDESRYLGKTDYELEIEYEPAEEEAVRRLIRQLGLCPQGKPLGKVTRFFLALEAGGGNA